MADKGNWLKLYRSILDDDLWKQGSNVQRVLMITLLAKAWWQPGTYIWAGHPVEIQPGQLVTSLAELTKLCLASTSTIRTALSNMQMAGFLTIKSTNRGRLITIVNWDKYQQDAQTVDKPNRKPATSQSQSEGKNLASQSQANRKPDSSYNMYKNIKEDKKGKIYKRNKEIYRGTSADFKSFAGDNQQLFDALEGWSEMRVRLKKPLTEMAVKLNLNKLREMSKGDEAAMVEIVNQSIMNSWQSFFPLKNQPEGHQEASQEDRRRRIKKALEKGGGWSAWTNHQNG